MLSFLGILVGLLLLLFGRRLYWVFVAAIGFLTGVEVAPRVLPGQPEWVILVTALGLALVGAVLAIVAQTLVITLVGFLAGGGIGVLLLRTLGAEDDVVTWVVFLASGVVGIALVVALFEWGLILLSSLAGARLIIGGVGESILPSKGIAFAAMILVAAIGVIVQASWLGAPPRRHLTGRRT